MLTDRVGDPARPVGGGPSKRVKTSDDSEVEMFTTTRPDVEEERAAGALGESRHRDRRRAGGPPCGYKVIDRGAAVDSLIRPVLVLNRMQQRMMSGGTLGGEVTGAPDQPAEPDAALTDGRT
ncbi:hypothetical protein DSL92_03965 [Billgrantia gudaonensis]|uniref:Uncharacterized protein n=1 Tax=Billgrantia gudaonensis TaxID=376427 RepID=A0A3S0NHH4_9GAMM|nr:hypothetical protein DSL92_03965 [Halomonas gudaonensis]